MMHPNRENHFAPGKLWSLLDMLELHLKPFTIGVDLLASAAATLGGLPSGESLNEFYASFLSEHIGNLRSEMNNLQIGGISAFLALERLEKQIVSRGSNGVVVGYLQEFRKILVDELSEAYAFTLSYAEQRQFSQVEPLFGEDVARKFPSITYEIDEIGKCLALSRSTAAAFHMLRCLEAAMRAVSRCLKISDPIKGTDRNWGNALRVINTEIENRWPKATRISGDGVLFERYHATLAAMANPYRNATMHLEDKYTEGEARSLLELVRGYLRGIAARMDEDGLPLA